MTRPAPITPLFGYAQADDPVAVVYLMVHQAALAAVGAVCLVECRRMAITASGLLRTGLWTVALSGAAAVAVVLWNTAYYTAVLSGLMQARTDGVVQLSVVAVYASVLGLAVGVTVPDWGPRLARRWTAYVQLRALEPAWQLLVAAVPEVELEHAYPRWDVERRLHRRVVEMRDAELVIRGAAGEDGDYQPQVLVLAAAVHGAAQVRHASRDDGSIAAEVQALLGAAAQAGTTPK
jgi:hypothetical protein